MLLGRLGCCADRLGHLACLAQAGADAAVLVADDHERAEGEATPTFDDFCYAVQVDDFLRELGLASSVLVTHAFLTWYLWLKLQSGAARGFRQRFDSTVVGETAAIEDDRLDARF